MNLSAIIDDNITELIVLIVEFTKIRQNVLLKNIAHRKNPDYTPMDLPVKEFCDILNHAIAAHIQYRKLVFRDSENVKFGPNGKMNVKAVVDKHARATLNHNYNQYLELLNSKLLENSLNHKLASELLRIKVGVPHSVLEIKNKGKKLTRNELSSIPWDQTES
jgi:flagellar basal body rod protein FlgB